MRSPIQSSLTALQSKKDKKKAAAPAESGMKQVDLSSLQATHTPVHVPAPVVHKTAAPTGAPQAVRDGHAALDSLRNVSEAKIHDAKLHASKIFTTLRAALDAREAAILAELSQVQRNEQAAVKQREVGLSIDL